MDYHKDIDNTDFRVFKVGQKMETSHAKALENNHQDLLKDWKNFKICGIGSLVEMELRNIV